MNEPTEHPAAALRLMRERYGRLHDALSDCIEGGRLTPAALPDDYAALVELLAMASETDDLAARVLATAEAEQPSTPAAPPGLLETARAVVANWETGDLAGAVRALAAELKRYEARARDTQTLANGWQPPTTQALADALRAVLPYAENEAHSLDELGRDDPQTEEEAARAWQAIETARGLLDLFRPGGSEP